MKKIILIGIAILFLLVIAGYFVLPFWFANKAKNIVENPNSYIQYYKGTAKDTVLHKTIYDYNRKNSDRLIRKIEKLINEGANPNGEVEYNQYVRKTGTYIPIIKEFYRNKYRVFSYISTPFHTAVYSGRLRVVKKMLEMGAKTNIPVGEEYFPVTAACEANHPEMIFFLLENGAQIKNVNLYYLTDVESIEKLVKAGANPTSINFNLFLSDTLALKRIIALNPEFENVRLDFYTIFKDNNLPDFLLKNKMPVSIQGVSEDCSLIFGAVRYKNAYALKKLIEKGANVNEECISSGRSVLELAFRQDFLEGVKILVSKGVTVPQNSKAQSLAEFAEQRQASPEIIDYLKSRE